MQEVERVLSSWFAHISVYSAEKYSGLSLVFFNWSTTNVQVPEMRFSCLSKDLSYWVMWKMRRVRELSKMGGVQKYEQEEKGEMWVFQRWKS